MHRPIPWLLLLVSMASSDVTKWKVTHPDALYAWAGACVWIPCEYRTVMQGENLDNVTVYLNPEFIKDVKAFTGHILYNTTKVEEAPSQQGRVQFLGDGTRNCTLSINPVWVNDSGQLGLRMMTRTEKWMEKIPLNVSEKPLVPQIQLPSEIRESETVTLTCLLNFACYEKAIRLQWTLNEGTDSVSRSISVANIFTKSQLTFQPRWEHHGKNVSCQLWGEEERQVLSQQTVQLNVKHHPRNVTVVIQNPTPIREGDSVTLSCNYTSSNPAVTYYKWDPRGAWTEPSPGVLLIQKVAWNVKNITCTACNDLCSLSHPVSLNVHYAPRDVRVLQTSPTSEVHSGHRVVLQCEFSSSYPREVRYIWKKNGGSFLGEGKQLTFDSVSPEDAGNYSCSVNNSIGQTASEARRLQVLYAPRRLRVSMTPANSMMEGQKAALTCESDANPPVSQYTWFDWNNQNLPHTGQTLRLAPLKVQHSGAYRCQGSNRLGVGQSPPSTLTVYYSPETIGRRVATGLGLCLAALILVIFGVKLRRSWKKIQSQQGLQENSSGQSFFVRNKKVRRAPLSEGHHVMGCCNPVMEDSVNYATLRFPETDTTATGDAETSAAQRLHQDSSDMVTYSVLQRPRVGDYENVSPDSPEDEGIHYSELIQFGVGQRPRVQENVEYVTLKH
ncbi:B-cell receptor CD22 isoform X4 [Nycticebus coucang]|uniref:B-cell receptor CD22 isoform X4 n=1 Tax=Nycticebus coucang TaxID=9470 RepID=UPI00234CC513|nr:B-cell receptor CD22 isoform X4 [Nycticebus coucang]